MKTDLTQLDKLDAYLKEHNIPHDRIDKEEVFQKTPHGKYIVECEQHQIIVPPQDQKRQWDVICHRGSYGHRQGLLELMGNIVRANDSVEGWLTADDVIERIEGTKEMDTLISQSHSSVIGEKDLVSTLKSAH